MDAVFLKLINMSIAASWLILAVVVLRLLLKKAPKALLCLLWALVAVRLICPFSIESMFSLIPSAETVPQESIYSQSPEITSGIPALNSAVNPVLSDSFATAAGASVNPLQAWTTVAALVWIVGLAAMLLYALSSFLTIKKRVSEAVPLRDNVWICDHIDTPFILGVFRPRIYLPSAMEEEQSDYVLTHEKAHLKRRDHVWKPLGFLLLSVYWFNPLCWLAYWLMCKDIELACDEKVIRDLDAHNKRAYSETLLSCSVPRRMISACPLAFGEVGVKERIKTVLNYKKPAFWVIVVAVVACVVVAVCFLTNPQSRNKEIMVNGTIYTQAGSTITELPDGSTELGQLQSVLHRTKEHPSRDFSGTNLDAKYPGCMIYQSGVDKNTILLEDYSGFYIPFVCAITPALTLNDVITLSEKGEALTWSDFDGYAYTEGGSGLYIRFYEIDARFYLMIGGSYPGEEPWYIRLVSKANREDYIDIRTEDAAGFIEKNITILTVTSGGETVTPPREMLWSKTWDSENGAWLAADGMGMTYLLPEIAQELPAIAYAEDFSLALAEGASFSYMSVFDANYERIYHNVGLDVLGTLPEGTYYVDIVVAVQGDNISAGDDHEMTGYDCAFRLKVPNVATAMSEADPLNAAISAAILGNGSAKPFGWDFACESHVTLATETNAGDTVTVYAMVLYEEYSFSDGAFELISGSHGPMALTFSVSANDEYTLIEYWQPGDGNYYWNDLRGKFPASIPDDDLDTQKYILVQKQNCYAQAVEFFKVDANVVIEGLLETVCSSPTTSSTPEDNIGAHSIEYHELTYYGDHTLRYVFAEFLKGGQTDPRGGVMRSLMDDLIGGEALKLAADTGQEYFDAWRDNAQRIYAENGAAFMRENMPKAWLLLQIMGE